MAESQSSSGQQGIDLSRVVPAKEYLKQHPQPVILHFQPKGFIEMKTPDELKQWEAMVRDLVGLGVSVGQGKPGGTETQTICDLSAGSIVDDCDYD